MDLWLSGWTRPACLTRYEMTTRYVYKHELVEVYRTEKTINEMGSKGWRLHSVTFSKNACRSINGDYEDGNQLVFERIVE